MKRLISLIIVIALTLGAAGNVVFAQDNETKLRVCVLDVNTLAKLGSEAYSLKKDYSSDEGYVIKFAAYDENNKLLATSNDSDYRTYFPKEFSKVLAFVWRTYSSNGNDIRAVSLQVGADETEKRLVWYNDAAALGGRVQYALKSDFDKDGGFTDGNSKIVAATAETPYGNTASISCKAVISDLQLGQTYVYRLGGRDTFDEKTYEFKNQNPANKQVFAMVSDLHVNAYTINSVKESNHVNTYNTNFKNLLNKHPDIQFVASTGDNVSQGNMPTQFKEYMNSDWEIYRQKAELEFEVLFAPNAFQSIPWASTLGNHEANNSGNKFGSVTKWHYNLPNDDGLTGTYFSSELNSPNTNGNFWFRNGDVLVVGINAVQHTTDVFMYSQAGNNAAYIRSAIEANKDAKWRVLINHVPPYSFIGGFSEPPLLRERFADMNIDQYDFDVVFTGHQHSYSRSKQLLTDDNKGVTMTANGVTRTFIKPTVVSEDKIKRSVDENGYSYDIATNPDGAVHINLPPFGWAPSGGSVHPDYADFIEVIATNSAVQKSGCYFSYNSHLDEKERPNLTKADTKTDWVAIDEPSSYVAVTVEETQDGQQMKFELTQTANGNVYDTYIIKKTF